jgi:hypothetical protein
MDRDRVLTLALALGALWFFSNRKRKAFSGMSSRVAESAAGGVGNTLGVADDSARVVVTRAVGRNFFGAKIWEPVDVGHMVAEKASNIIEENAPAVAVVVTPYR